MLKKRRLRKGRWGERGLQIRVDVTDEPVVEYEQLVHQERGAVGSHRAEWLDAFKY